MGLKHVCYGRQATDEVVFYFDNKGEWAMCKATATRRIHPPYSRFKAWLTQNHIDLQVIAKILNITATEVSRKNNGYSDYSIEELNELSHKLGVNLNIFKPLATAPCSTFCSTKMLIPQKQVSVQKNKEQKTKLICEEKRVSGCYWL